MNPPCRQAGTNCPPASARFPLTVAPLSRTDYTADMRKTKALSQCYALQDLLFGAAHDPGCSKPDLAKLSLAWERLEERKRVLRGRPLPGSLRPKTVVKPQQRLWRGPVAPERVDSLPGPAQALT